MTLNKAEVLFTFDHVDDATRRMMVESLLDRIIAMESTTQYQIAEWIQSLDVKLELERIKEARDAERNQADP